MKEKKKGKIERRNRRGVKQSKRGKNKKQK